MPGPVIRICIWAPAPTRITRRPSISFRQHYTHDQRRQLRFLYRLVPATVHSTSCIRISQGLPRVLIRRRQRLLSVPVPRSMPIHTRRSMPVRRRLRRCPRLYRCPECKDIRRTAPAYPSATILPFSDCTYPSGDPRWNVPPSLPPLQRLPLAAVIHNRWEWPLLSTGRSSALPFPWLWPAFIPQFSIRVFSSQCLVF